MGVKKLGIAIFVVGIILLHASSSFIYLWDLLGIPIGYYPFFAIGPVWGFLPPVAVFSIVIGGLIYSHKYQKEE